VVIELDETKYIAYIFEMMTLIMTQQHVHWQHCPAHICHPTLFEEGNGVGGNRPNLLQIIGKHR